MRPGRICWRVFAVLLLTYFPFLLLGQTGAEWKPVPADELNLKDDPGMLGAVAILLDRDSHVDDEKSIETEYYRIKILREDGRRFADIEIPYVPKAEEVGEIKARRVRPDGTSAEFQGEIFDRLIIKSRHFKYQAKQLSLPDVQAGDIIEYSYRMSWHQHVPDVLKHPEYFLIESTYSIPTVHWKIQHELFTRHARFSIRPIPKADLRWTLVHPPSGAEVKREEDGNYVLEVRNVPPVPIEEFSPPEDLINSRVHFFYGFGFSSSSTNGTWYWQSLARREAADIEKFIGRSKKIEHATAQLISPGDSEETKLRKIYDRVQRIRYLSYEPEKTDKEHKQENLKANKSAEDVLEHGYANANEINYLFAAMVRSLGLQAYVVKLADRSHHVFDRNVLDATQFDALVIDVTFGKEHRFFDPATRFCPFEMLPWGESGVVGLRVMPFDGQLINIPGYHSETAVMRRNITAKVLADGTLEGRLHISFAGQEALARRLDLYDEDWTGRTNALETEIKGWMPDNAKIEINASAGWASSKEDLDVECQFSVPEFAARINHRMLVPLTPFSKKASALKSYKRTLPIYFPYSHRTEDLISLSLPEGFRLEGLPAPHSEEALLDSRFKTVVTRTKDGVELQRTFDLNGFIFDKDVYAELKHFFGLVSASDSEQLVLQQVSVSQP